VTTKIGQTHIDVLDLSRVVERVREYIRQRDRAYLCLANVHVVEQAKRDDALAQALDGATLTLPDGKPVAWAAGRLLRRRVGRVSGSDVFDALLRQEGMRHFFYGSTGDTLARLQAAVEARYPGAVVCGSYPPPFRALPDDELRAHAARINDARPDVVWVGLGAPRQEIWMARARELLEAPVLVGVGAVFDFAAGTRRRAPRWMQQVGLEWLHRLAQEPRRLGPRYVKTNLSFLRWATGMALRAFATAR
jgi:N-acetylglucosaminyldiphosphoundecaprenol N-acetyl-beta-D-mannosaminyltransferase